MYFLFKQFSIVFYLLASFEISLFSQNQLEEIYKSSDITNELEEISSIIENKKIDYKKWHELDIKEQKKLASLCFIAKIKNPILYLQLKKINDNKNYKYHQGEALFAANDLGSYDYENKLIVDIARSPFILICKTIKVDTIKFVQNKAPMTSYYVFEYLFMIKDILTTSIKEIEDTINIKFQTSHRMLTFNHKDVLKNKFYPNKTYLIFTDIENDISNIKLGITKSHDEGFLIENDCVIDKRHYFSNDDRIHIDNVKSLISKKIKEIISWRY